MNILFSAIIPTCDRPGYLPETIRSVLAQTYPPEEILIMDNGRVPADPKTLPQNSIIRIVRTMPRVGVSQARNMGVLFAKGTHLAFLDDDDSWEPGYLQAVAETIERTGATVVLAPLRVLGNGRPLKGKQVDFSDAEDLIRKIHRLNPGVVGSNIVISREAFYRASGFDPTLGTHEDKALVHDLVKMGERCVRADNTWVNFRIGMDRERLTSSTQRMRGKWRYTCKYWKEMGTIPVMFNLFLILRLFCRSLVEKAVR